MESGVYRQNCSRCSGYAGRLSGNITPKNPLSRKQTKGLRSRALGPPGQGVAGRCGWICRWLAKRSAEAIPVQAPATSSAVLACLQQEFGQTLTGLVVLGPAATGYLLPLGWIDFIDVGEGTAGNLTEPV